MINRLFDLFVSLKCGTFISYILAVTSALLIIAAISWIWYVIFRLYLNYFSNIIFKRVKPLWHDLCVKHEIIYKILVLVPAIVTYLLIPMIQVKGFPITYTIVTVLQRILSIYMIFVVVRVISALFSIIEDGYSHIAKTAIQHPITSYVQIMKIILWAIAIICIVAVIIDKSPATLFAGLGALTAVIMLVFKDSILGLVASVQLSAHNMVSIGDCVDIPSYNASGEVIHISLSTVKIRNDDNSITMLPTYVLLSSSIINWCGVDQMNSRRVKRSLTISPDTVKFCDQSLIDRLSNIKLIEGIIPKSSESSTPQITNITIFRAYIRAFLAQHEGIKKDNACLVKELQPTAHGIPIELYFYTHITDMVLYEDMQADIFDHLFAILPVFDLKMSFA
ncbi:Miniconductance mechanosensitive channel [Rickettsiales bacterium Ac37b]|nr:Miniconductance mechanosensitive channel [Rickettsiales bacterium Ac37b]